MVTANELLRELKPFRNEEKMLVDDQSTGDIIRALLRKHEEDKSEYDKIYQYFVGSTDRETAKNIFDWVKKNVRYKIEQNTQVIKTPSAIIATGNVTGSDCKNYSLFTNGLLDSYRRNEGKNFGLAYRFASYDSNSTPQHVFAVMQKPNAEVWVDPVLNYFDEKKEPTFYKDKKIDMSLIALAGVDPYDNTGSNVEKYPNGFKQYGNYQNAGASRPLPPSSKGTSGIGGVDYTPYFLLAGIIVGGYFLLKK